MTETIIEEILVKWLAQEKEKGNYVNYFSIESVVLDGGFDIQNLIEQITKYIEPLKDSIHELNEQIDSIE